VQIPAKVAALLRNRPSVMPTPRVLVVEPDVRRRLTLQRALSAVADVTACGDFQTARHHIIAMPPDLLITNLRLQAYNGLHLMALAGPPTRAIVSMDPPDPALARTARAAGAMVETPQRLAKTAVTRIGSLMTGES
jgi:DNA-binding NtrC family response regulator